MPNTSSSTIGLQTIRHRYAPELLLASLAIALTGIQYLRVTIGGGSLFDDARVVWQPIAQNVLDGQPLYASKFAVDNKPPLFQYVNILVAATGQYVAVWHALIAACNAIAATFLYRWVTIDLGFSRRAGLLPGLLFVTSLPFLWGTIINVRSFALIGILVAVRSDNAVMKGGLLAAAGLFSQWSVVGIPVLLYDHLRWTDWSISEVVSFCAVGLAVVAVSYLSLTAVWGWDVLRAGVKYTILSPGLQNQSQQNLLVDPVSWARGLVYVSEHVFYVLAPAAIGGAVAIRRGDRDALLVLALAVSYSLLIGIKTLAYYWLFPLPFWCVLAGYAFYDGTSELHKKEH